MNSTKKSTIILFILIYFSLFINTVNLYSNSPKVEKVTNSKNQIEKNPKTSSYWDLTGFPIYIDNFDPNYNWSKTALENEWCRGIGTIDNPYIIENITIDGQGSGSCIEIRNSNVYFIIRNCTLFGSDLDEDGGIKFESVNNGKLIDNNCSRNGYGIFLCSSSNNNISRNIVNNNMNHGIRLQDYCGENTILRNHANLCQIGISLADTLQQNIISENNAYNNFYDGIYLDTCQANIALLGNKVYNNAKSGIRINHSYYIEIIDNFIDNNTDYGIFIWGTGQIARACKVSSNNITNNYYGIYLRRGSYHEIYKNNVSYNNHGIYSHESFDNNISNNIVEKNERGIYLENSNKTYILYNKIINNTDIGLSLVKSNDNHIFNNVFCDNHNIDIYQEEDCERNEFGNNEFCDEPPENGFPLATVIIIVISIVGAVSAAGAGMIIFRKKSLKEESRSRNVFTSHKLKKKLRKTEAEVIVEKESHVCLVHRGKITGAVYICPKCETYYCMKCAITLKENGETCWACNNEIELE